MKRNRPILTLMTLGMVMLTACSTAQPNPTSPNESPPTQPTTDIDTPSGEPPPPTENPWVSILGDTSIPLWTVTPCDGTAPFLCVSDTAGNPVGTVEFQSWSLGDRPDVVQALTEAGLDPDTLDPQDPAQRDQILAALTSLVEDLYSTVAEDHATGGLGGALMIEAPAEVRVGSLPAILYRFDRIGNDSSIQEKTAGYMALDGDRLYVITTAAAFNEPPGFGSVEQLHAFLPYLDIVVGRLKV
jgi:hypothetical protein